MVIYTLLVLENYDALSIVLAYDLRACLLADENNLRLSESFFGN